MRRSRKCKFDHFRIQLFIVIIGFFFVLRIYTYLRRVSIATLCNFVCLETKMVNAMRLYLAYNFYWLFENPD